MDIPNDYYHCSICFYVEKYIYMTSCIGCERILCGCCNKWYGDFCTNCDTQYAPKPIVANNSVNYTCSECVFTTTAKEELTVCRNCNNNICYNIICNNKCICNTCYLINNTDNLKL